MTTPSSFRKTDVTRALAAVAKAGVKVAELRFPPEGGFVILTGSETPTDPAGDDWNDVLSDEA